MGVCLLLSAKLHAEPKIAGLGDPDGKPSWIPPTSGAGVVHFGQEPAALERLLVGGFRVLRGETAGVWVSSTVLPVSHSLKAVEIPDWLGGGFLFYTAASGVSSLWHSATWTAELKPLLKLDFEVEQWVFGFDRIYALARHGTARVGGASAENKHWQAIDLRTGKLTGLGALPAAPSYTKIVAASAEFGAVRVPYLGVLVTRDAGQSWQPLAWGRNYEPVRGTAGNLYFTSQNRTFVLAENAELTPVSEAEARSQETATPEFGGETPLETRIGTAESALRAGLLYGFQDTPQSLLAAHNGVLFRVNLADGQLLQVRRHSALLADCLATAGSAEPLLLCKTPQKTWVFAVTPQLDVAPLLELDGARRVNVGQHAELAISGGCSSFVNPLSYCVYTGGRSFRDVRINNAEGMFVAGQAGMLTQLVPPTRSKPGYVLHYPHGKQLPLDLSELTAPLRESLFNGLWLADVWSGAEPGTYAGWVMAEGHFRGVRIAADGKVSVAGWGPEAQFTIANARYATLVDSGVLRQTQDGGFTWQDSELPLGFAEDDKGAQRCMAAGCVLQGWIKLGYPKQPERIHYADVPNLPPATLPRLRSPLALNCVATAQNSKRKSVPVDDAISDGPYESSPKVEPWPSFWGVSPPLVLSASSASSAIARFAQDAEPGDAELTGYVWGNVKEKQAQWLLRVRDPFQFQAGIWSTRPTRWPSGIEVGEVFNRAAGLEPTVWRAALDSSGNAGLLSVVSRSSSQFFEFRRSGSLRVLGRSQEHLHVSRALWLQSAWFFATWPRPGTLRISKLDDTGVHDLAEYDETSPWGRSQAELIRNEAGTRLALWVRAGSAGYLYPLDPQTGELSNPWVINLQDQATLPACTHSEGFVLDGPFASEPRVSTNLKNDEPFARIWGRFRVTSAGVCIERVAALFDSPVEVDTAHSPRLPGALELIAGVRANDQIVQFRCGVVR